MQTGGTDGLYRAVLAAPHRMTARIEIWDSYAPGAVLLEPDLPFLSGYVTATLTSRVASTCTFTVDESFYPRIPEDNLAPYGNVVRAYRGVEMGDGSTAYEWNVFTGLLQEVSAASDGVVTVNASDLGAEIVAFEFEQPRNSDAGALIPTEVRTLISEALPGAAFGTFDDYNDTVQQLTWEFDRAAALDEMATAVGSFWYCLPTGRFVLRRYPWTVSSSPLVVLAEGDGGVITSWRVSRSRVGVFNSVVVTGERLNGDAPVRGVARDVTPGSATLYGGHFGVRVENLRLQTPASDGAAQTAADDALRRDVALQEWWQWEQTPDGSVELGDVVNLHILDRTDIIQVIDSYTLPLDLSGAMSVSARSLIVPALSQPS